MTNEGSPVFDYTSLDFDGAEADLIRYAQSRFPDQLWTDLNESNDLRRIIELMAYAVDLVSYTGNSHVLETVVTSLIREQNFRNLAKTYDFTLKSASPANLTLQLTIDVGSLPLPIPSTFKVSDETGDIIFQPVTDEIATTTTFNLSAIEGNEIQTELLAVSNGRKSQQYQLANSPLIDDTETITVGGAEYTKVVNFIEASSTDEVYKLETTEDDITFVIFGDGINGLIPPIGQNITATYKVGGGSQGNLPVGTVTQIVTPLAGVTAVTNITTGTGGGPKQTLANAKRQLPLSIKANDRAVTVQDYATFAVNLVSGVLKASGVAGRFVAGGSPIILYIVPNGGGSVSSSLAAQIISALRFGISPQDTTKSLAGKRIIVKTALYTQLEITVDVFVQRGSSALATGNRVRQILTNRYSLETVNFGDALDEQDAYNVLDPIEQSIDGLNRVFFRRFRIAPHYNRYVDLPTTGDGTVDGIQTSNPSKRREWNIRLKTPVGTTQEFDVYERRLGFITTMSNQSIEDETGRYEDNELLTSSSGYRLRVREQDQLETFEIVANTNSTITISGLSSPGGVAGLLTIATPSDSYALERLDANLGKIAHAEVAVMAPSGQPDVEVSDADALGFQPGEKVLVRDSLGNSEVLEVAIKSIPGGTTTITFTTNLSFDLEIGDDLDWFWESATGDVGFALVNGSTVFSTSDQLYVDVYDESGDVLLRPENFPTLPAGNLIINTVGGVK